jgi:hypothetical protein
MLSGFNFSHTLGRLHSTSSCQVGQALRSNLGQGSLSKRLFFEGSAVEFQIEIICLMLVLLNIVGSWFWRN